MGPPNAMIQDAKAAHDDEIKAAAAYFSSVPVQEMDSRRRSEGRAEDAHRRIDARADERRHRAAWPAHHRNARKISRRTELRDAASGFVAYVPAGSIKNGESLVKTGAERRSPAARATAPI